MNIDCENTNVISRAIFSKKVFTHLIAKFHSKSFPTCDYLLEYRTDE